MPRHGGVAAPTWSRSSAATTARASTTLVRVPNKFKDLARFRAGTHVVARFVDARELEGRDDVAVKVTGELRRVLYAEQVKEMRRRDDGTWPSAFEREARETDGCALRELAGALEEDETRARATARSGGDARDGSASDDDDDEGSSDGLPPLVANRNRRRARAYVDSDESSDSD